MKQLWNTHPALTGVSLALIGVLAACIVGLTVDPRTIAGAPAWLKPAKFAASLAIYTLTLAWILALSARLAAHPHVVRLDHRGRRGDRGRPDRAPGVARHHQPLQRRRHLLDTAVFETMGVAILVQWIASIASPSRCGASGRRCRARRGAARWA